VKKIICISLAMILFSILITACGNKSILNISGSEEAEPAKMISSEIAIPILKYRTLNPVMTKDEDVFFMEKLVYDPLVRLDGTLSPIPGIASGWVYSDDGMTLTFDIRKGIFWHDGKELTAEDVKFTFDVLLKAQYSNYSLYKDNIANIKSVTAKDSGIVVKFKTNTDNDISNFVFPIIPKHQFSGINKVFSNVDSFMPIGTGPYKVTEIDAVKKVVLEPNDEYYGDKKAGNTLVFKIIPNKRQAVNLFDIGDLMITFSEETDRNTIFEDKDVNIFPYLANEVEVLGFNFSKPALKDKRVRQAIANAIDTQEIIENAYYNNGVRNDNIYFPNYLGKNSAEELVAQNYEKAVRLLAEAGFINRDEDIFVEDSSGNEIEIGILVNNDNASRAAAADIIKNSLDKLPIHSYIILKDWSGYTVALNSGQYDIYIGGFKIEAGYDMRFALKTGNNLIGYSNLKLDALLDKMESGIDSKTKLETYTEIKEILNEELPYHCLAYKTYAAVTSKSMQGIVEPYFFDIYHSSEDWKYEY